MVKVAILILFISICHINLSHEKELDPKKEHYFTNGDCGIISSRRMGRNGYWRRGALVKWRIMAKDFDPKYSFFHLNCSKFRVGRKKNGRCMGSQVFLKLNKSTYKKRYCGEKMMLDETFYKTKKLTFIFKKKDPRRKRNMMWCKLCMKTVPPLPKLIWVFSGEERVNSSEIFNPKTGKRSKCKIPLPEGVDFFSQPAMAMSNGVVTVCSPDDDSDDCWQRKGTTWTAFPDLLLTPSELRHKGYIHLKSMDKLMIFGGETAKTFFVDPMTMTVKEGTDWPHKIKRTCAVTPDEKMIYVVAGMNSQTSDVLNTTYTYDLSSNTITSMEQIHIARRNHHCGIYKSRYIIVAGGRADRGYPDNSESYDLEAPVKSWTLTGNLNKVRGLGSLTEVDGELYFIAGYDDDADYTDVIEKYNGAGWDYLDFKLETARGDFSSLVIPGEYVADPNNCA